ncbi:MAG: hypothetical protein ABUL58_00780 [Steroidobacter sp.]
MPSLVGNLPASLQSELYKNLNFLNIKEYQGFCDKHNIPCFIHVHTGKGLKRTAEKDRKNIVLKRIRSYLRTGRMPKCTVFPASAVCADKVKIFTASTRLHFGQYNKKDVGFLKIMRTLTGDRFADGMIARVVIRDFWTDGVAPTLKEYAQAWLNAMDANTRKHPEYAYLTDLSAGSAGPEWKKLRTAKAEWVLAILNDIPAQNG